MSRLEDELADHLGGGTVPFLFVGAGISRRYVALDSWEGLLRRFAAATGKPYDRYTSDAEGDLALISSALAEDFNPIWWEADQYKDSRKDFQGRVHNRDSPLKIEVARMMAACLGNLVGSGHLAEELKLLKKVTVDGVITTNYDPLLEHVFPSYKTYIGQKELLFAEAQSIAEIYKIHGSWQQPDSLVLTARDYDDFDAKNPYLAAKLMTIFVDHPIVFLGYRMGDRDVTRILNAIASALTTEHLTRLQDRLIYVTWDKSASDPHLSQCSFSVEGGMIPMRTVAVADYAPIYRALGRVKRKLPARLLRQLKERVYELVLTNDPVGALRVVNIEDDVEDMDVVFAVGAIARLGRVGYFGVDRNRIIDDLLEDTEGFDDPAQSEPCCLACSSRPRSRRS